MGEFSVQVFLWDFLNHLSSSLTRWILFSGLELIIIFKLIAYTKSK